MEKIESQIIKTCLKTFFVLMNVLLLIAMLFSAFFPKIMKNLAFDLNMKAFNHYYSERTYEQTKDINDLYDVVLSAQAIKKYDNTIKYAELLLENDRYFDFVEFIESRNYENAATLAEKIALCNEDNYIKSTYVQALASANRLDEAIQFAIKDFNTLSAYSFGDRINWVLRAILIDLPKVPASFAFLGEKYFGASVSLINQIEQYLLVLEAVYDAQTVVSSLHTTQESFQYVVLKSSISKIALNIAQMKNLITLEIKTFDYYTALFEKVN